MIVYINTDELSDETIMKIGEECGIEGTNSRQIIKKMKEITKTIQETHEIMITEQIKDLIDESAGIAW